VFDAGEEALIGRAGVRHFALVALLTLASCGTQQSPPDRCASTTSSLQALEPTCWVRTADGGN
jgi:hypothetical protein